MCQEQFTESFDHPHAIKCDVSHVTKYPKLSLSLNFCSCVGEPGNEANNLVVTYKMERYEQHSNALPR